MRTMKAAVLYGSGKPLVMEERTYPSPGAGEVVIRVQRCGICGSELHVQQPPHREFPQGLVMGHEFAGVVEELGAGVIKLAVGDLVAVYPSTGCGACEACRRDNQILCPQATRIMGGYAEFACVHARAAVRLPAGLTAVEGALIEPLAVGLYGVRVSPIEPGDRILVLGGGSVAMAVVFWARRLGAGSIVVMSRSPRRTEMARAMGADAFVRYGDEEAEQVMEALRGPPDIVFECIGLEGFVARAVRHCRPFGTVISLGLGTVPDPVVPMEAGLKAVSLQFAAGYSRKDFRYAASTMLDGPFDPRHMITSVVPLGRLPETFSQLLGANGETKVHIAPHLD